MTTSELFFSIPSGDKLSAILQQPVSSRGLFVLGHGSGSNMCVPLMAGLADALFEKGIATLRFQYPYSESPDFIPFSDMPVDDEKTLIDTIHAALEMGRKLVNTQPVFVGGHSISGFMTTVSAARTALDAEAIIALAFPRKGDPKRAVHLKQIQMPMLIVQGTEDTLGTQSEIREMVEPLQPRVQVKWVKDATHVFEADDTEQHKIIEIAVEYISHFVDDLS